MENELISNFEVDTLRKLASTYMEFASKPIQKEKVLLWKNLNNLKMSRPMVVIDQLPINELNSDGFLNCVCKEPFLKKCEFYLRESIYKQTHFAVDMISEPSIPIDLAFSQSWYGIGVNENVISTDLENSVKSHSFTSQLNDFDDIEKIKDIKFTFDKAENEKIFQIAEFIFGDIAPIKKQGYTFSLGIWDRLSELMGVTNIYYDLMDRPEFIHAILRRITDSTLAGIKSANELLLHNDNCNICHCSYTYNDILLPDYNNDLCGKSQKSWAFGMAQLFSSVSPHTTEEFEIPYITEMAKEFGMIYYGCCDKLSDRLDLVKKIPNVKKVSCSPWSNIDEFAKNIGKDLIMSVKPNPALLAQTTFDSDLIKKDLQKTFSAAKENNVNCEIILKDISTVKYDPTRITQWAEIALDMAENY